MAITLYTAFVFFQGKFNFYIGTTEDELMEEIHGFVCEDWPFEEDVQDFDPEKAIEKYFSQDDHWYETDFEAVQSTIEDLKMAEKALENLRKAFAKQKAGNPSWGDFHVADQYAAVALGVKVK
jgi:hypothetical protein